MLTGIAASALAFSAAAAAPVAAKDTQVRIVALTQPAQDMGSALNALALATQTEVMFDPAVVRGVAAPALNGKFTAADALARLLKGTNLTHVGAGEGTYVVRPFVRVAQTSSPPSQARPTQTADARPQVEEVIVTAQKREERLQDVPIAISVLRGEDLDRATVDGIASALRGVPGVAPNTAVFGGSTNIAIRGVASGGPLYFGSSPVAYYVDSVPFGLVKSALVPDASAYDLERVEVLRGPQGTLYGANAQNGVVRILTKDADPSGFEFKTRSSISTTERGTQSERVDAAVNVPLSDKFAVRTVLGYEYLGGWIDRPMHKDANDARLLNIRFKANGQLTDNFSIMPSVWLSRSNYGAPNYSPDNRQIPFTREEPIDNDFDAYGLKATYTFQDFSITSATSYVDYSNYFLFYLNPTTSLDTLNGSKIFTQDVYLASSGDGPWRWTAGGSYRNGKDRNYQTLGTLPALTDTSDKSESYAVFGELTRAFLDGEFELTGGLRYFHDSVTQNEPGYFKNAKFNKVSPRAVLTWHADQDMTVYASYGEGFRSGFNQTKTIANIAPNFPPLKADNLHNYEIGAKGNLWGGRIKIDTALYYIDWEGVQQVLTVPLNPALNLNSAASINGVSASGIGTDFAITADVTDRLTVGLTLGWNGLSEDAPVIAYPSAVPAGVVLFQKGERLNLSPETTIGVTAEYTFPLPWDGYEGRVAAAVNHLSSQFYRRLVANAPDTTPGEATTIGRVSAAVNAPENWSLTFFVDNVNNEQHAVFKNWTLVPERDLHVRPRTFGLQLDYRF